MTQFASSAAALVAVDLPQPLSLYGPARQASGRHCCRFAGEGGESWACRLRSSP
jgi:hypothetical protein